MWIFHSFFLRTNSASLPEGLEKTPFFGGFLPIFVLFFASSLSICIWKGYFEKKTGLACFFWPQGPLIQSSAAPQGSPPPIRSTRGLAKSHLHFFNVNMGDLPIINSKIGNKFRTGGKGSPNWEKVPHFSVFLTDVPNERYWLVLLER